LESADRGDALGVHRVADVEEEAVPFAGAAGEAEGGIDGDVVALRRARTRASGGGVAFTHHLRDHLGDRVA
jgi:hypothetical protein